MKTFFLFIALAVAATVATAQNRHTVKITVQNIESSAGRIMIGIYDKEKDAFEQGSQFDGRAQPSLKGSVTFTFNLPAGTYAFAAYHDVNDNGVLDRNWLGIPKEPYIMSGNRKLPSFKASSIKIDGDKAITMKL